MAHYQQLQFVEIAARHMAADWTDRAVIEIGSADVNGSIRQFFPASRYIGVDLAPGPGVDVVGSGHEVQLASESADLTISCECFEHNPVWRETFLNMHRMTKPGGIVIVTCASRGRLEHGTTRTKPDESPNSLAQGWDYYRNLNRTDFERALPLASLFETHAFFRNDVSKDLYFAGRTHGPDSARQLRLDVPQLRIELGGVNTLVSLDEHRSWRQAARKAIDLPLEWADRLPDPVFQDFVIRWKAAERAIRRWLRRG